MARAAQLLLACLAYAWLQGLSLVEAGRQRYAVLHAGDEPTLQGTWSSGSGKVVTGQGFFNPRTRSFTPPSVPGQAYSFTSDGYWEFAKYRVTPNRKLLLFLHNHYLDSDANLDIDDSFLYAVRFDSHKQENRNASNLNSSGSTVATSYTPMEPSSFTPSLARALNFSPLLVQEAVRQRKCTMSPKSTPW